MSFTVAADPRSPWPFGDPVATALLGLLEVELRGRGLHWRVEAPERVEVFRKNTPESASRLDVSALRERMLRSAKADWPDLVEQTVTGWLSEARRNASPAWAAPLRSRLLPAHLAVGTAGALARGALPGLTEVVLCETGPRGGGRLLAADQAGALPAGAEEVFAAARANVHLEGELAAERVSVDGARLTLLTGPGPYCPTHVFWLGEYLERDGAATADGALVVLPHRHLLAYHAIESTETVAAVGALLRLASRQFETAPGALTDRLYWWRADAAVSVLPVDEVDETLRILPHPEFEGLLARLPSF